MYKLKPVIKVFTIIALIFLFILISSKYVLQLTDIIIINNLTIEIFINNHYLLVVFLSTILFILIISFMSPITPFVIIIGYYFSFFDALAISFLSQIIGSIIIYSYSNRYFKTYFNKLYSDKFNHLKSKFESNSISFLVILRVVGGIPFALQTIIVSIFGMELKKFILATAIGVIPYIYIFTSIGGAMNSLINTSSLNINILLTI